jgi:hypothetical protein
VSIQDAPGGTGPVDEAEEPTKKKKQRGGERLPCRTVQREAAAPKCGPLYPAGSLHVSLGRIMPPGGAGRAAGQHMPAKRRREHRRRRAPCGSRRTERSVSPACGRRPCRRTDRGRCVRAVAVFTTEALPAHGPRRACRWPPGKPGKAPRGCTAGTRTTARYGTPEQTEARRRATGRSFGAPKTGDRRGRRRAARRVVLASLGCARHPHAPRTCGALRAMLPGAQL